MTASINAFFHMGGYGFYVWSAYGSVAILLSAQWFFSWRRWNEHE
jgi:heme exporter protein CcmD